MQNIKRITKILIFTILILLFSFQYKVNAGTFNFKRYKGDASQSLKNGGTIRVWQEAVYYNNTFCVQHGTIIPKGGKSYVIYGDTRNENGAYKVADNELSNKLAYILYQGTNGSYSSDYKTDAQKALWNFLYTNRNSNNVDVSRILNGIKNNINNCSYSGSILTDANAYITKLKNFSINIDALNYNESANKITGKISIKGGNSSNTKVVVKWGYDTNYSNTATVKSDGTFEITEITSGTSGKTVYVKATSKAQNLKYDVWYYILKRSDGQNLITVVETGKSDVTRNDTATIAVPAEEKTNVSLQKYITKINGTDVTQSRSGWLTADTDTTIGYNADVKASIPKVNTYKYKNPIEIGIGDKVTYTIYAYNNSDKQEIVLLKDQMSYYTDEKDNVCSYTSIDSIYETVEGGSKKIVSWQDDNANKNTIKYQVTIPANKYVKYDITLKYTKYTTELLKNTAWISTTQRPNVTTYRTKDRDYVKINQTHAVSLEKYISKIDGNLLSYKSDYDFNGDGTLTSYEVKSPLLYVVGYGNYLGLTESQKRRLDVNHDGNINSFDTLEMVQELGSENRRFKAEHGYPDASDQQKSDFTEEDLDKNYWKKNNPRDVSNDSTITYTIELFNDSKETVYVKTVTDNFQFLIDGTDIEGAPEGYTGEESGTTNAKFISNPSVSLGTIKEEEGNNQNFIIELTKGQGTIPAYGAIKIDLTVTLDCEENEFIIQNTAKISEIEILGTDRNYYEVEDTTLFDNFDSDYVKVQPNPDVSLEKYIIGVTDATGTNSSYNHTEFRANLKTSKTETAAGCNKPASIWSGTCKDFYKYENAVEIEAGDKVTYRIYVYNNSEVTDLKNVIVKDGMPYTTGSGSKTSLVDIISIKDKNGNNVTYEKSTGYDNTIQWNTGKIDKNSSAYYDVTLQFNTYNSNVLTNSAWISTTNPTDSKSETYRTADRDYVKMQNYSVSLEKYVSGVGSTRKEGTALVTDSNSELYNCSIADRSGHPTYAPNGYSKQSEPVLVESGDTVTYTIKLTNTGKTYIKDVEFTDTCPAGLTYKSCTGGTYNSGTITYTGGIKAGETATLTLTYSVDKGESSKSIIKNTATISKIKNRNGVEVKDSDGTTNNTDSDWIKLKEFDKTYGYKVSLEKYVIKVNGNDVDNRAGYPIYNNTYEKDNLKYKNPVTVASGDEVTYEIKVKNDGKTSAKITKIEDSLPEGISQYKLGDGSYQNVSSDRKVIIETTKNTLLDPGDETSAFITVKVTEPNISVSILKNIAEITEMQNRNSIVVTDTTPKDNKDADYIQLKDITIQGTVWNDLAEDNKDGEKYDGKINESEKKIEGVEVYLYNATTNKQVDNTTTGTDGKYSFPTKNFSGGYIKGPKTTGTDKWAGTYYKYYVIFEYDGITYTSTIFADVTSNDSTDSNAKEDGAKVNKTRADFNSDFNTIDNNKGIKYETKNENGYMPQSNHIYDPATMAMQSSTNSISLSNNASLEEQLKHVNLGLRGRDIFDLELMSDVYQVNVTVNGITGVYNYDNQVYVRTSDITNTEDMANVNGTKDNGTYLNGDHTQSLRNTDIATGEELQTLTGSNYDSTGLGIEVTYKFTVKNTSKTHGTATKVIDYYDTKYEFINAYADENKTNKLITENGDSGSGFNSVIITTQATELTQSDKMDIYVVYKLNDPTTTLAGLLSGEETIPTFNMAEIFQYKTFANGDEATRGLLDKDSASGSVNKEQVRTTETIGENTPTKGGNPTTVEYYFKGYELNKLKYEDDTDAVPTLYFGLYDKAYTRTLTGTVFEDYTKLNSAKVKSGNGKMDATEPSIEGITVELYEGTILRYTTKTGSDGSYKFSNFLPGDYTITYHYGDTEDTFLKTKNSNKESYNGEDFQSTNNSYIIDGLDTSKISTKADYWYLDNETEGISVANDNSDRRTIVSENVVNFLEEDMIKLNTARQGKDVTDASSIIDKTKMFAATQSMRFNVEKTDDPDNSKIDTYEITNMNFGIAQVPVVTIDLQKEVDSFKITDSTGKNVMVSAERNAEGKLEAKINEAGNVQPIASNIDVSIEDEKLQGARLEVTYNIKVYKNVEINYDNSTNFKAPNIEGMVDFINNNLSYNEDLGENKNYWELISYSDVQKAFGASTENPRGTIDPKGEKYSVVLKAKDDAVKKLDNGTLKIPITLEKVLTSTDATLDEIITSTTDSFVYSNIVEITGLNYNETLKDRIRTADRYIIVPGAHYDSASSEDIVIHPPTGYNGIDTVYYIIAAISLGILAAGVFGIKRFVLKK